MSAITVQMGHVARTSGATGTYREQEFARSVGSMLQMMLRACGHEVALIGADQAVPPGDVFVALHTDGSTNPARRGASVGYPDAGGQRLARAWKRRHQEAGYPGGWLADNYTDALRGYYGFGRAARAGGYEHRFLAEHGTTTNADDVEWLFDHIDTCALAHVHAIGDVVGHPDPAGVPADPQEDTLTPDELLNHPVPLVPVPQPVGVVGPTTVGGLLAHITQVATMANMKADQALAVLAGLEGVDEQALAQAVAPLLAPAVVAALADQALLSEQDVEQAIRRVLGSLDG